MLIGPKNSLLLSLNKISRDILAAWSAVGARSHAGGRVNAVQIRVYPFERLSI